MLPASLSVLSSDTPPLFLDLLALPRPLALAIFALLPVDTRLRCVEVSRAWRALLADVTLWTNIVASSSSGLAHFNEALLRAAVAKAGGQLRALDVTGQNAAEIFGVLDRVLLEFVLANSATLTELRVDTREEREVEEVRALLEAAPMLKLLETSVSFDRFSRAISRAMLRNEPPFQAVRLRGLSMNWGFESEADVLAICSDLRCHASLEKLGLFLVALNTGEAMGAVVDAGIELRLCRLDLERCYVLPALLPELTRLIAAGALRQLALDNFGGHNEVVEMFDEAHESTRLFVAAVRASAMTRLELVDVGNISQSVVEAAALINARQQ